MLLYLLQRHNPKEYKIPILTQWAFLGLMLPIFFWLPETPCEDVCDRSNLRRSSF
jgi:hypothetical protein